MKKCLNLILLVFGLISANAVLGQCEKILVTKDVRHVSCGNIQFKYIIEKGTSVRFEWILDGKYIMGTNDFLHKFTGKRYIPFSVRIWNDCSDYKIEDSIYINYEPISVMATYGLQNCTEAKFHFLTTDQSNKLPRLEWTFFNDPINFVTSTEAEPTHIYPGPGKYNFILKYEAMGACEIAYYYGTVTIKNTASASAGDDRTICMYNGEQILTGIPEGGIWSGNGVDGNTFDPEKAGVGKHELLYTTNENQCTASDKLIFIVKNIDPDFTADIVDGIAPLTVNFTSKLENNQFANWGFGDLNSQSQNNSQLPNPSHTYNAPGTYNVTLNIEDNETGCSGERVYQKMIRVYEKTQHNIRIDRGLAIYPNPTKGDFKFVIEKPENVNYNIEIISINGQLIMSSGTVALPVTEINLSNIAAGLYLVKVNMDNGKTLTAKLVLFN